MSAAPAALILIGVVLLLGGLLLAPTVFTIVGFAINVFYSIGRFFALGTSSFTIPPTQSPPSWAPSWPTVQGAGNVFATDGIYANITANGSSITAAGTNAAQAFTYGFSASSLPSSTPIVSVKLVAVHYELNTQSWITSGTGVCTISSTVQWVKNPTGTPTTFGPLGIYPGGRPTAPVTSAMSYSASGSPVTTSQDITGYFPTWNATAISWLEASWYVSNGSAGSSTACTSRLDSIALLVTVSATSPVASFSFSPGTPVVNQQVNFNGTSSTTPNGSIASYNWLFGDATAGATTTNATAIHSYANTGNFTATLTVTDSFGFMASVNRTITVKALCSGSSCGTVLTVTVTAVPSSTTINQNIVFSASASGGVAPYGFSWSFGDGSAGVSGTSPTHAYSSPGTFTVSLTAKDSAAPQNSGNAAIQVTVTNPCTGSNCGSGGGGGSCTYGGTYPVCNPAPTPTTSPTGTTSAYSNDWFGFIDQPLGSASRPDLNFYRIIVIAIGIIFTISGAALYSGKGEDSDK